LAENSLLISASDVESIAAAALQDALPCGFAARHDHCILEGVRLDQVMWTKSRRGPTAVYKIKRWSTPDFIPHGG